MENKNFSIENLARRAIALGAYWLKLATGAAVIVLPAIMIENHNNFEFWKVLGCYGVYLMGIAAFLNGYYPSSPRS